MKNKPLWRKSRSCSLCKRLVTGEVVCSVWIQGMSGGARFFRATFNAKRQRLWRTARPCCTVYQDVLCEMKRRNRINKLLFWVFIYFVQATSWLVHWHLFVLSNSIRSDNRHSTGGLRVVVVLAESRIRRTIWSRQTCYYHQRKRPQVRVVLQNIQLQHRKLLPRGQVAIEKISTLFSSQFGIALVPLFSSFYYSCFYKHFGLVVIVAMFVAMFVAKFVW